MCELINKEIYSEKTRYERMMLIFDYINSLEPAKNGLEAYSQISNNINLLEDNIFGRDFWTPPRTFQDGTRTERLYPIMPENFFTIDEYKGVMLLLSKRELLFISRHGAIELQNKIYDDKYGESTKYSSRIEQVIFKKNDYYGDNVWHKKNIN